MVSLTAYQSILLQLYCSQLISSSFLLQLLLHTLDNSSINRVNIVSNKIFLVCAFTNGSFVDQIVSAQASSQGEAVFL